MRLFLFCLFFFSFSAGAKLFQNTYISFEIPDTWDCKAFGTDWVCHSRFQEKKVEALITSTAKIAGPNDTIDDYLSYLQQQKVWLNSKQEEIVSEKVGEAKTVFINQFPWVDSIHKNSEVKSYISRYAGTVCCKGKSSQLGILLVLSAHQDHYTKYSADFVKTIKSLRVLDIEEAISRIKANQQTDMSGEMANYLGGLFDEGSEGLEGGVPDQGLLGSNFFAGAVVAFAFLLVLIYFVIKKRKRRSRRRRRRG